MSQEFKRGSKWRTNSSVYPFLWLILGRSKRVCSFLLSSSILSSLSLFPTNSVLVLIDVNIVAPGDKSFNKCGGFPAQMQGYASCFSIGFFNKFSFLVPTPFLSRKWTESTFSLLLRYTNNITFSDSSWHKPDGTTFGL